MKYGIQDTTVNGDQEAVEIEATVKAFSGEGRRSHKLSVSQDGTVRVWDSVAGHYTTCHSMSTATQTRIRKMQRRSAPGTEISATNAATV